jgi:predicted transcriptional regulator
MSFDRKVARNQKRTSSMQEQLASLQNNFTQLVMSVNTALQDLEGRLTNLAKVVEAASQIVGQEVIEAKLGELEQARNEARLAAAKAALEKAVTDGTLVAAEAVGEKSLIVGRETDKDGKEVGLGRFQMNFSDLKPEFKEKLKDQKAGFSIELPEGGKYFVQEIYSFVEKTKTDNTTPTSGNEPDAAVVEAAGQASPNQALEA